MEISQILATPVEQLFHNVFLPFILAFAILWGALLMMPIFNKRIKFVLALVLSILALLTPQFDIFTSYVSMLGAQLAIVLFFIVFGFGILATMFRSGKDIYDEKIDPSGSIDNLRKKAEKARKKGDEMDEQGHHDAARKKWNEAKEYDEKAESLRRRREREN